MPVQLNPNAVNTSLYNRNKSIGLLQQAYRDSQDKLKSDTINSMAKDMNISPEEAEWLFNTAMNSVPMGMTRGVGVGNSLEKGGAWNMFKRPDIEREAATHADLAPSLGLKSELAGMTPREYLDAVAEGFSRNNPQYSPQQIMEMITKQKAPNAGYYVQNQASSLPFLEYGQKFSQEGIHRALAAEQRGIDEIPVMLLYQDGKLPARF